MTPLYLLCLSCHRAWTAPAPDLCCLVLPVACSPWSGPDRSGWRAARFSADRAQAIWEAAHARTSKDHRRTLARGATQRGRRMEQWRAVR